MRFEVENEILCIWQELRAAGVSPSTSNLREKQLKLSKALEKKRARPPVQTFEEENEEEHGMECEEEEEIEDDPPVPATKAKAKGKATGKAKPKAKASAAKNRAKGGTRKAAVQKVAAKPKAKGKSKSLKGKKEEENEPEDDPAVGGAAEEGKATFAKRYRPKRPDGAKRWDVIRAFYGAHIQPEVNFHSWVEASGRGCHVVSWIVFFIPVFLL